jgi:hypothetical protein
MVPVKFWNVKFLLKSQKKNYLWDSNFVAQICNLGNKYEPSFEYDYVPVLYETITWIRHF